jgi:hypothetical protein
MKQPKRSTEPSPDFYKRIARSFKRSRDAAHQATVWYAIAQWVSEGDMEPFRFQLEVSRPAMLPNDVGLAGLMRKRIQDHRKLTKDDKEMLAVFGTWRSSVMEAEASDIANIRCLLNLVAQVQHIDEARPVVRKLVRFVEDTWKKRVYLPVEGIVDAGRQAERIARNEATMATWMLNGDKPPRYVANQDATVDNTGPDVFGSSEFFDDA